MHACSHATLLCVPPSLLVCLIYSNPSLFISNLGTRYCTQRIFYQQCTCFLPLGQRYLSILSFTEPIESSFSVSEVYNSCSSSRNIMNKKTLEIILKLQRIKALPDRLKSLCCCSSISPPLLPGLLLSSGRVLGTTVVLKGFLCPINEFLIFLEKLEEGSFVCISFTLSSILSWHL